MERVNLIGWDHVVDQDQSSEEEVGFILSGHVQMIPVPVKDLMEAQETGIGFVIEEDQTLVDEFGDGPYVFILTGEQAAQAYWNHQNHWDNLNS